MSTPMISLVIVIKGPVAKAGSILNFSNVKGTIVPKIEANNTTVSNDNDTAAVIIFLPIVKCLSLQGGGILDGAFLQAGLINELSLVVYPGIDGAASSPSIFEYIGKEPSPARRQSLELLSAETMQEGVVWLRYKFHKEDSRNRIEKQ